MKYHIWTEGCQMNVADSMRVASSLEKLGYHNTEKPADADVIILNTCVVRQSAEDKAIGRLSSLKPLKMNNPDLVINLMGCLVGVKDNPRLKKRFRRPNSRAGGNIGALCIHGWRPGYSCCRSG